VDPKTATVRLLAPIVLVALVLAGGCRRCSTSGGREVLRFGDIEREYVVHLPGGAEPQAPAPLVLALHGGSGTGRGMARLTGLDSVADREGFIVVYPEGVERQWNDGRTIVDHGPRPDVDDVGFLVAVVERVAAAHQVDRGRVFVTGISNGAMMSMRLAVKRPDVFAAAAGVAGAVSETLASGPPPAAPIPVLLLNGTEDPLVPFAGGDVTVFGRPRGKVLSTPASVAYWVQHNGAEPDGVVTALPDRDSNDRTRVERIEFRHPGGAAVVLLRVQGGGHTWPGGLQYLPEGMIGTTSRDIDASELIWDFFETRPRQ
jgi:polyhydroxybutyrate depolymerase